MPVLMKTVLLLTASNVFMTFAWYAHLKDLKAKPWLVAALVSWGIALLAAFLGEDQEEGVAEDQGSQEKAHTSILRHIWGKGPQSVTYFRVKGFFSESMEIGEKVVEIEKCCVLIPRTEQDGERRGQLHLRLLR